MAKFQWHLAHSYGWYLLISLLFGLSGWLSHVNWVLSAVFLCIAGYGYGCWRRIYR